jgi:hypothetical protein
MAYIVGDLVRLKVTWTDINSGLHDPEALTCRVKDPAGEVSVYTLESGDIVHDLDGVYHCDVPTGVLSGMWHYRWESTGRYAGAEEGQFYVDPSTVI